MGVVEKPCAGSPMHIQLAGASLVVHAVVSVAMIQCTLAVDILSCRVRPSMHALSCHCFPCLPAGVRTIAPNGFMNGTAEGEHAEDVYPDGPLQSGTQSLRRVKQQKSRVSIVSRAA